MLLTERNLTFYSLWFEKMSKTLDFSRLITGKIPTKITHAASRYVQSSDIGTVENSVQDNKMNWRKV